MLRSNRCFPNWAELGVTYVEIITFIYIKSDFRFETMGIQMTAQK